MKKPLQKLTLECVDGKDDRLIIPFDEESRLILGKHPENSSHHLNNLEDHHGYIVFYKNESGVSLDASNCNITIKVNGKPVSQTDNLSHIDIIRIGEDIWRLNLEGDSHNHSNPLLMASDKDSITGLEDLNSINDGSIFSEVFKKKSYREMEDQLLTGTSRFQPDILDIEVKWAKPWLFARFMLFSMLLGTGFYIMFMKTGSTNILPGLIFISQFAIPLSVLLFFMEMNTPRNVSIFTVMMGLFAGAFLSFLVTLIINGQFNYLSVLGSSSAGITEETAKIITAILIFGRIKSFKWIHNGLLIGATVGCGFTAFESAGYVLTYYLEDKNMLTEMIVMRSSHAPLTHIIWTANAAAALWWVKGEKNFTIGMLFDKKFLRIFLTSMLIHMTWNAPFLVYPIPIFGDVKCLLLGFIGISISLKLVQAGLKQIIDERKSIVAELAKQ